jgi:hypothetical protein
MTPKIRVATKWSKKRRNLTLGKFSPKVSVGLIPNRFCSILCVASAARSVMPLTACPHGAQVRRISWVMGLSVGEFLA